MNQRSFSLLTGRQTSPRDQRKVDPPGNSATADLADYERKITQLQNTVDGLLLQLEAVQNQKKELQDTNERDELVRSDLDAMKGLIADLTTQMQTRLGALDKGIGAIMAKPDPVITMPPPVVQPIVSTPAAPSYKKEIDQINATLAVLIARTTPIPNSSPPTEISFDVVKNGLGEVVSLIARRT